VQGTVAASCQLISSIGAGVRMCEVDFSLTHGTITTRGLTDAKNTKVRLVITGGTGRYAGAWGQGTLTPTATGSVVGIRPHR